MVLTVSCSLDKPSSDVYLWRRVLRPDSGSGNSGTGTTTQPASHSWPAVDRAGSVLAAVDVTRDVAEPARSPELLPRLCCAGTARLRRKRQTPLVATLRLHANGRPERDRVCWRFRLEPSARHRLRSFRSDIHCRRPAAIYRCV